VTGREPAPHAGGGAWVHATPVDAAAREPVTITVTGPESTGKTTLAVALGRHLGTTCSAEFSRGYAEARRAAASAAPFALTAADVEPIARGQIALEDSARAAARAAGHRAVVHDTDLVSTVVYARHYFGACPQWVVDAARTRRAALYLLCDVDVPWVADGVRDRPHARDALLARFAETLAESGADTVVVRGTWDTRIDTAVRAADALLHPRE
jgi:NadR type nicotinamide-nucleotide adenylyltransferase